MLDEDFTYDAKALWTGRQSSLMIRSGPYLGHLRDVAQTEIFPGSQEEFPKTLVFAKLVHPNAEDIVHIVREVFGKGQRLRQEDHLQAYNPRRSATVRRPHPGIPHLAATPRIAVTVDMIATGTDIKPLEMPPLPAPMSAAAATSSR